MFGKKKIKNTKGGMAPRSNRESVKTRAAAAGRVRIHHQNAQRQAMPDSTPSNGGRKIAKSSATIDFNRCLQPQTFSRAII